MTLQQVAPWVAFCATVAGAGVGYGRMQERIDALEAKVAAVEDDGAVVEQLRSLRCFIARLHNVPQPECP